MTQMWTADRDEIMASWREPAEQMLAASRRTSLELADAMGQALTAVADAQEKLADTSEPEWVSRLLRAQAAFTRDMGDASSKFVRDALET
jgi:hypothetical protein